MAHAGKILSDALLHTKYTEEKLAQKIGRTRKTIYNWRQKENIPIEILIHIGKVINYDFSPFFPELVVDAKLPELMETLVESQNIDQENYREKYYSLLEKHIKLHEEFLNLIPDSKKEKPIADKTVVKYSGRRKSTKSPLRN